MSYQVDKPQATCDVCGVAIPWRKAHVTLITTDSAYSSEDYEVLCLDCKKKQSRPVPAKEGGPQ